MVELSKGQKQSLTSKKSGYSRSKNQLQHEVAVQDIVVEEMVPPKQSEKGLIEVEVKSSKRSKPIEMPTFPKSVPAVEEPNEKMPDKNSLRSSHSVVKKNAVPEEPPKQEIVINEPSVPNDNIPVEHEQPEQQPEDNDFSSQDFYLSLNVDTLDVTYKLCDDFGAVFKPYISLTVPGTEPVKFPIFNIDEEKLNVSDIVNNDTSQNTSLNISNLGGGDRSTFININEKKYFYKAVRYISNLYL